MSRHIFRWVLSGVIAVAILLPLGVMLWFKSTGGHILSVQTNSMHGTFAAGDGVLVISHHRPLRTGDVISFRSQHAAQLVISHSIVELLPGDRYLTKGDVLTQTDPIVQSHQVIGQVIGVLPYYGRTLQWLRSPTGLAAAVYGPSLAVVAWELNRLRS